MRMIVLLLLIALAAPARVRTPKSDQAAQHPTATPRAKKVRPPKNAQARAARKTPKTKAHKAPRTPRGGKLHPEI